MLHNVVVNHSIPQAKTSITSRHTDSLDLLMLANTPVKKMMHAGTGT